MRILLVHNYYQHSGGEDSVFHAERQLLVSRRHHVRSYTVHNKSVTERSAVALAQDTVWSRKSYGEISRLLEVFPADVVHFHNTFPLVSPAAYYAVRRKGAAVVQTLHNYRLLCLGADFFRHGAPCQACIAMRAPWRGVFARCYRNDLAASAVTGLMLATHNVLGTWSKTISCFVAPSQFAKSRFIAGGLPAEKLAVKPHFVATDDATEVAFHDEYSGRWGALYVGRLVPEKGVKQLLVECQTAEIRLTLVGSGPLETEAYAAGAVVRGQLSRAEVQQEMRKAAYLVAPSQYYETFGLVIIEAFANALAVIVPRGGAFEELVVDGQTGLLFDPSSPGDLRKKLRWASDHPDAIWQMGHNARRVYEEKYTPERNYEMLMEIYEAAIAHARSRGVTRAARAPAAPS